MKALVIYLLVIAYAINCCNYFGWDFRWTSKSDAEVIAGGLLSILFALGLILHKV